MSILLEPSPKGKEFQALKNNIYVQYLENPKLFEGKDVPLTPYALKTRASENYFFKNSGKSGYNPIEPPSLEAQKEMSAADKARFRYHADEQRHSLHGFMTWELKDSGCWPDVEDVKPSNLSGPLHPVFARANWCRDIEGAVAVGGKHPGVYTAMNEVVWDQLLPILQLATRLLEFASHTPWFDALVNSPRKRIDPSEITAPDDRDYKYYQISRRSPELVQEFINHPSRNPRNLLKSLSDKVRMVLGSPDTESKGLAIDSEGKPEGHNVPAMGSGSLGITMSVPGTHKGGRWPSLVIMSRYLLAPLIHDENLTVAERLVQQTYFAKTVGYMLQTYAYYTDRLSIVVGPRSYGTTPLYVRSSEHRLTAGFMKHAIKSQMGFDIEPFFEDEECNELGWSWENSVFGGKVGSLPLDSVKRPELPRFCVATFNWPNFTYFGYYNKDEDGLNFAVKHKMFYRNGQNFAVGTTDDVWPLPVSFIENLHQTEFWELHIQKLGPNPLVAPRILGKRFMNQDGWQLWTTIYGPDYRSWKLSQENQARGNADAHETWRAGQNKRLKTDAYNTALRKQDEEAAEYQRDLELLEDWKEKAARNPNVGRATMPSQWWDMLQAARWRIELRDAQRQNKREEESYKGLTPEQVAERQLEKHNKTLKMLEEAAKERDAGNQDAAFELCDELFRFSEAKAFQVSENLPSSSIPLSSPKNYPFSRVRESIIIPDQADIFAFMGTLHTIPDRIASWTERAIWRFRQLQMEKVPGDWQTQVDIGEERVKAHHEAYKKRLKDELGIEQAQLDVAMAKKNSKEPDSEIAKICVGLIGSKFVSIRAQAHLLIAELRTTKNKSEHAKRAAERIPSLHNETKEDGDWAAMNVRVRAVRDEIRRRAAKKAADKAALEKAASEKQEPGGDTATS